MQSKPTLEQQKEYRRRWVEALRSGKYRQGVGSLRIRDTFCCLGVACDVFKDELGFSWNMDGRRSAIVGHELLETSVLLPRFMLHLGLSTCTGEFKTSSAPFLLSLAKSNDDGKTFAEIADIIESEPEGLFEEVRDVSK
jgi:hypothetical protein